MCHSISPPTFPTLRWKHNTHPPDFELVLAQDDPELWERWGSAANLTLLAALRRRARLTGPACRTSSRCLTLSKRTWKTRPRAGIDGQLKRGRHVTLRRLHEHAHPLPDRQPCRGQHIA